MEFIELNKRPDQESSKRLMRRLDGFNKLIIEISKKEIPDKIGDNINNYIEGLNSFDGTIKAFTKQLSKSQFKILKLIEKELKIVPKNHYRNVWLAIGMAGFGIPLGAGFGASLGNMAFIGIGIPIGLAIGIAIGSGMDKRALEEGRVLDIEINN